MIEWNDYRIILSVARTQSLYKSARDLDVAVSTVMRRLEQIEERAGARLFRKTEQGHIPTDAGAILVAKGNKIEALTQSAENALRSEISARLGTIRISASEVIAPFFVARHLPTLRAACPDQRIIISVTDQSPSQGTEGFDISLWPSTPSNEDLFGRKITGLRWARYGVKNDHDTEIAIAGLDASETAAITTDSLAMAAAISAAGGASAMLPCLLGETWPRLARLGEPTEHRIADLWAIYHKDVAELPHIRRALDVLAEAAVRDKDLFYGTKSVG